MIMENFVFLNFYFMYIFNLHYFACIFNGFYLI